MIKLALAVDADARAVRKDVEDEVEGVEAAQLRPRSPGPSSRTRETRSIPTRPSRCAWPSASSRATRSTASRSRPTPRSAAPSQHAEAHGNKDPYELPASWLEAEDGGALELETPLNFVSTADIIGGNSGSPVVNRDNEVVGLIFDGNIQSLVLDFGYDDKVARAVSVDSRGIVEALRSIYQADRLVKELTGH